MDIVIDTSALIAVIVGKPERDKIIAITAGNTLIGGKLELIERRNADWQDLYHMII